MLTHLAHRVLRVLGEQIVSELTLSKGRLLELHPWCMCVWGGIDCKFLLTAVQTQFLFKVKTALTHGTPVHIIHIPVLHS